MSEEIKDRKVSLRYQEGAFPSYSITPFVNRIEENLYVIEFTFVDPHENHAVPATEPLTAQPVAKVLLSKEKLIMLQNNISDELNS